MKRNIFVIIVLIAISLFIFGGCASAQAAIDDSTYSADYIIDLRTISSNEVDSRYIPVEFENTNIIDRNKLPEGEPNFIDMSNLKQEPVTLDEVRRGNKPNYSLFYFIDENGSIQLRAYGEIYKCYYTEDENGKSVINKSKEPEKDGKGMYEITPVRTIVNGVSQIDFLFYFEGTIKDAKPIEIDAEKFF